MIQYYLDLEKQVKKIADAQLEYGQIQKIYSTAFFISFSIRTPGKTWHLFFGRGNGQEGLWLHDSAPPSELRRKDTFLEYLRRHLSSCSFVGLELDPHDRIVKFNYQKFGQIQSILFFWKARKLYFIHHYQEAPESQFKLLLSWHGKAIVIQDGMLDLFNSFDEVGRRADMQHDLQSAKSSTIKELLEDEKKAANLKTLTSGPQFLKKKIHNIEQDLEKTRQWNDFQSILDRGDSLDDIYELKVGDHKVKFEGELNAFERRNLLFQKIKKLKRGEGILNQRLSDTQELYEGKKKEVTTDSVLPIVKPIWGKEERKIQQVAVSQNKDEYRIFKFSRFSVGVGLSSTGNDQLRSRWATKEDLWLHLDSQKSSHAIIKFHGAPSLETEILNVAASILAHFSHFNDEWIPVIYTSVKNLKGVAGSAGMVIYKKEKHLRCLRVSTQDWLKD